MFFIQDQGVNLMISYINWNKYFNAYIPSHVIDPIPTSGVVRIRLKVL